MIQLQVDFSLLNKFFGVPLGKISQYANKDIEEIMELEATQGNEKAKNYKKILEDPDKLLEIFKLSNVENKYIILQNMSEDDLDNLLPFLTQEQLSKGLNFFTEEKLIALSKNLPIEALVTMIFEKFDLFDVLKLMQDDAMDKFLLEPDVERKYMVKYFESLNGEELRKLMVKTLGSEFEEKTQKENLQYINNLDDNDFRTFILSIEKKDKMELINGIVEQNQDLLLLFKPDDLVRPMENLMKEDKVKLMSNLESEFLIPMIKELPVDLTQIVLTQIDPRDFSEILAKDFQDILSSVVLFSTRMN